MAALMRFGWRQSRNFHQFYSNNYFVKEAAKKILPLNLTTNIRCLATVPERKKRLLIDIHSRIDHNVGISTELFDSLLSTLEENGPLTEHDFALLLHICSFGPFDSPSADRLDYAEKVWNKLQEMDISPTSKLYNMRLKVYCSNEKRFTPVEELSAMKTLGINPDKITYGFLIEGFCQNGDIAGANLVLEAMNEGQIFIGVSVFNSFITGHLKAGSPDEAVKVMETLKSRGLSPNSDTYYRFIQHYAQEGDVESAIKYIHEAAEDSVPLDQGSLMKIYRSMLLNGKKAEARQLLPILSEKDVFRNTSMQNLCQLVAEGFHDEAFHLYLNIPKAVTETVPVSAGSFLLKSMITNNGDAKDVLEIADKLVEANPTTIPHRFALLHAYRLEKFDLAVQLLENMISRKQDVRIPMILPAMCHFRDTKDLDGIYKTVDMIMNVDTAEELVDTLDNFCLSALNKMKQSKEDIVARMKEHESKWNTFFVLSELQRNGCDAALESMTGKSLNDSLISWLDSNRHLLVRDLPQQKESCVNLLVKLTKKYSLSKLATLSVLMNRLNENDLETAHLLLDALKKEKIRLPDRCLGYRKIIDAPQDLKDKIKELCEQQPFSPSGLLTMKDLREKTKEELEEYVKKNPNQIIARIAILNKALFEKDTTEIQKRLREIEALKFSFPKYQRVNIITTLTDLGETQLATQYLDDLKEAHGTGFSDTIPLSIAVKHVEQDNIQGALEMIETAKQCDILQIPGKEYVRRSKISLMMNSAKTMEDAEAIHSCLVQGKNYLSADDANTAHYQYIKKALELDDDKRLLARLNTLRDKHWTFPCMDSVITRFIQKQDIEGLKEVVDLGISIIGNNLFHHKLASNFIACDMPSKAASIFQKLGDRLNTRALETSCKYFVKNKQINHVETLVEVLKTLPVSRAFMLKQLIDAYVSSNDMVKATDVLHTFENECIVPHKSTLDFLVASFKKRGMEQPQVLQSFLSRRETLDETRPRDNMLSSSSSDSESSSSSDSDSDLDSQSQTARETQQKTVSGDSSTSTESQPKS